MTIVALFTLLMIALGVWGACGHLTVIATSLAGIRSALDAQNRAYGVDADSTEAKLHPVAKDPAA